MSESRIDHAAEARRLQGWARDIIRAANAAPGTLAPHMAAVIMLDDARLEAQLEITEQLRIANEQARIANLIALAGFTQSRPATQVQADARAGLATYIPHDEPEMGGWPELHAEIREALGL